MDPASIVGLSGACLSLAYRLRVLANNIHTISKAYHEVERTAVLIDAQLTALSAAVSALQKWLQTADAKRSQMLDEIKKSVDSCDTLTQFILEQTSNWQSEGQKATFWRKTKYLWNEPTISRFEGILRGQVQALSLLLQVKDLTPAEQKVSLSSESTSIILRCARDDTSSLIWLRDADSTVTITSTITDNLDRLDRRFEFDELIFASKAYRSTLASFLKQKVLSEGRIKNKSKANAQSDEMPDQSLLSVTDIMIESPQRTVIRRKPVSSNDRERSTGHRDSSVSHHDVSPVDRIPRSPVRHDSNITSNEHSTPDRVAGGDWPLRDGNLASISQRLPPNVGATSDITPNMTLSLSFAREVEEIPVFDERDINAIPHDVSGEPKSDGDSTGEIEETWSSTAFRSDSPDEDIVYALYSFKGGMAWHHPTSWTKTNN